MVFWLCFLTRIANRGCLRSFLQKQDSSFRYYMCPLQSIKSNQIGSICHLYIQKEQLETFLTKKKHRHGQPNQQKPEVSTRSLRTRLFRASRLNVWSAVFQRGECIVTMPGSNCNRPWSLGDGFCWVFWGFKTHSNHLEPQGQPFINACFNWMMNQIFIGNG